MAKGTRASKDWKLPTPAPVGAMGRSDIPPIVAQVLYNRGITTGHDLDLFLDPSGSLPHDPGLLPGMGPAVERLSAALDSGETVGIFGDFDVDGVTATALLAQGLGDLGLRIVPYIPHRVAEGHGLNEESVLFLKEKGVSVLVTVDCGITSRDEVALARDLGMDVIITDHHVPTPVLPPALAIIDPKLDDSLYPFPVLSGAGLAFKLIQGLYSRIGQPWSRSLLELAALSTVADLVPMKDENRFLVKEGLKELRHTRRRGLLSLYRHAGIRAESIDVETISFMIAPRLNAAGRLEDASASYRLLLTDSVDEAEALAARLEGLNRERQQISEETHARAREIVMGWDTLPPILLVYDQQFLPGISGLVASRLVEEFHRPAVVMTQVDGTIRASARSIPGFDVGAALSRCRDMFIRHGGHPQAAGFVMSPDNMNHLKEALVEVAAEAMGTLEPRPAIHIDAEVSIRSLTGDTFHWLKDLEPFGVDNPPPVFLTRNLRAMEVRPVGARGQHLRMKLKDDRAVWDAMAFRQADRGIPDSAMLDVVYRIGTDRRRGTEMLTLNVLDFQPSATR